MKIGEFAKQHKMNLSIVFMAFDSTWQAQISMKALYSDITQTDKDGAYISSSYRGDLTADGDTAAIALDNLVAKLKGTILKIEYGTSYENDHEVTIEVPDDLEE